MLNYKHLHYFWIVAREGGIARASERLHLTPQSISGQLGLLEDQLGTKLFTRVGRNLEISETGRLPWAANSRKSSTNCRRTASNCFALAWWMHYPNRLRIEFCSRR
jgi:hypothetical protein